jgi:hypothetical protein
MWDPTSHLLKITGEIFFDGPIQVSGTASYQGQGTIYAAGTITFSNNAQLCGVAACDATWDPGTNLVVLVAGASTGTGMHLQQRGVRAGDHGAAGRTGRQLHSSGGAGKLDGLTWKRYQRGRRTEAGGLPRPSTALAAA